jgi:hypothetical protein
MPYAQLHYPFENTDFFQRGFPADFIAEGIDQTRGCAARLWGGGRGAVLTCAAGGSTR